MKDPIGNEFEPCPGEERQAPGALREEAQRLRVKAHLLDDLADQTDGTLSKGADSLLQALLWHSTAK